MKLAFTFPPDYDGELHVVAAIFDKDIGVSLQMALLEGETEIEALRRLGQILVNQPIRILREYP
jgi:hypothetical protein